MKKLIHFLKSNSVSPAATEQAPLAPAALGVPPSGLLLSPPESQVPPQQVPTPEAPQPRLPLGHPRGLTLWEVSTAGVLLPPSHHPAPGELAGLPRRPLPAAALQGPLAD